MPRRLRLGPFPCQTMLGDVTDDLKPIEFLRKWRLGLSPTHKAGKVVGCSSWGALGMLD